MQSWNKVKFGDISIIESGGTPSSKNDEYWSDGNILWVTLPDQKNKYIYDTFRKITLKGLQKSSAKLLPKNTVIFSSRATIGEVSIAKKELTTNQGSKNFICDAEKIHYEFLFYLLKGHKHSIKSVASGATFKEINKTVLSNYEVQLPPLPTQQKIASLLSNYDNLIENNTRRIHILEEMAQRIYKEWFVDFKYPGHENDELVDSELGMIPEAWETGCVSHYYDVRSGFAFKSKDMVESGDYGIVKIKNIQSDGLKLDPIQYISEELIQDRAYNFELIENDLLIAMTGAQVGKVGLMPKSKDRFLLNQRVGKFFPKAEFETNNMFMYQLSKSNIFQISVVNIAQGAAQPNISGTQIGSIQFPGPPSELILRFEKLCESIKDEVLVLNFKNQKLNQTRDLLLPKLISGKIDVSDLDIDTSILND